MMDKRSWTNSRRTINWHPPPPQDHRASMCYRMHLLTSDLSKKWSRLAFHQTCCGAGNERLDGTNNVTEQVIGQCVKERYCTIRGYKRAASNLNVSSLIGWARARGLDYDMSELLND